MSGLRSMRILKPSTMMLCSDAREKGRNLERQRLGFPLLGGLAGPSGGAHAAVPGTSGGAWYYEVNWVPLLLLPTQSPAKAGESHF